MDPNFVNKRVEECARIRFIYGKNNLDADLVFNSLKDNSVHICPICFESPLNPVIFMNCEHVICSVCYRQLPHIVEEGAHKFLCPFCRTRNKCDMIKDFENWGIISKTFYNYFIRIKCPTVGCNFEGNLSALRQHFFSHDPTSCPDLIVKCGFLKCSREMKKSNYFQEEHHKNCMFSL
jgi:hypothetical protein